MSRVEAVLSDFGGVLTTPLDTAFAHAVATSGVPLEALGQALAAVAEQRGTHPLADLETGRQSERRFLRDLADALEPALGRSVDLGDFAQHWFSVLEPNHELIDYYRTLRGRGIRLALVTNNVREWEARWRAMLPVDELFEFVVDSAWVGVRKPEPAIFEIALERIGLPAERCAFVDDLEVNVEAARGLGLRAIRFESTPQAIAALEELLGADGASSPTRPSEGAREAPPAPAQPSQPPAHGAQFSDPRRSQQ